MRMAPRRAPSQLTAPLRHAQDAQPAAADGQRTALHRDTDAGVRVFQNASVIFDADACIAVQLGQRPLRHDLLRQRQALRQIFSPFHSITRRHSMLAFRIPFRLRQYIPVR